MTAILPGLIDRSTARQAGGVMTGLIVDNFAGAGGASLGIEAAMGRCVDVAINHSRKAVKNHSINHPHTRHLCEDVWDVDPAKLIAEYAGRHVALAWFSPDCKHFSKAKGSKPLSKKIRGLAWIVIKWAKALGPRKPRVIILENVEEFVSWGPLDSEGKIIAEKKGQTFLRWVAMLRGLGYEVEHRELVAANYGVPTTRKRFFLIARCDGRPIRWPRKTHAPGHKAEALGRKPWRSAAECIDWTRPCPSIFLTREQAREIGAKRPLAEATMRRIARGLVRYVLDAAEPFVVCCNHGGDSGGLRSAGEPVRTITASRDANGVVVPFVAKHYSGVTGHGVQRPIGAVTAIDHHSLVEAFLAKYHGEHGETNGPASTPDEPLATQDTQNRFGVVGASLVSIANYSGDRTPAGDPLRPLTTVTAWPRGGHHAVVGATLVQSGYGEREGQQPRVPGIDKPLGTVVAGGVKQALAAAHLTKFYGCGTGQEAQEPLPTITGQHNHLGEVRAFLVKYYGSGGQDQDCRKPMHTLTAKARMGLVTVAGQEYQITDVGLRMLDPKELLRAQFGRFADEYVLHGTKADQVAAIGNSVCPELAEAIVRANLSTEDGDNA